MKSKLNTTKNINLSNINNWKDAMALFDGYSMTLLDLYNINNGLKPDNNNWGFILVVETLSKNDFRGFGCMAQVWTGTNKLYLGQFNGNPYESGTFVWKLIN